MSLKKLDSSKKQKETRYTKYFSLSKRLKSNSRIALVRGEMFEDFIKEVISDEDIKTEHKAFFVVCLCGGLRVSEGLSLSKNSFFEQDGNLFAEVNVLKKRRLETRTIMVHPVAKDFVSSVVKNKIGKLFNWSTSTTWAATKRYFKVEGITTHSLRHSALSYYLFEERMTKEEVSKLVHINSKTIDVYAHLDETRVLKRLFKTKT